jgi:hypothetical protein
LIQAAANIYANIFNLPIEKNQKTVAQIASKIKPLPFIPKNNVKIEVD